MQSTRDFLAFLDLAKAADAMPPAERDAVLKTALDEFTSRVQEDSYVLAARRIVFLAGTPAAPAAQAAQAAPAAPAPTPRPKSRAHG